MGLMTSIGDGNEIELRRDLSDRERELLARSGLVNWNRERRAEGDERSHPATGTRNDRSVRSLVETPQPTEDFMTVARTTEITAMSPSSFDDAIREGLERAKKTLHNLKSSWIKDQEVLLVDGKPDQYKVTMKVTFVLDG